MKAERQRWIDAGITLGRDPPTKMSRPKCEADYLSVTDAIAGNTLERWPRCSACAAINNPDPKSGRTLSIVTACRSRKASRKGKRDPAVT